MKIPPRKPPTAAASTRVRAATKKPAAQATGHTGKSGFDAAAAKVGGAVRARAGSVAREVSKNFIGIKRGLRAGDDASVRAGVSATGDRLKLTLPDLSRLTGWGAFGALGGALGHKLFDATRFNRPDYRHVMHLARAAGGKINDPDPSNGRVF